MKRKYKRIGFTAAQKAELWDRWQKGEGLKSIDFCVLTQIRPFPDIRRIKKTSHKAGSSIRSNASTVAHDTHLCTH